MTGPGTDPAALRVITIAVLAGLVVSGIVVVSRHGAGGLGRASPQAMARLAPSALARSPGRHARSVTLLDQAARACQTTAYAGVEVLGEWGGPGEATSVMNVWHAPGRIALAQPVAAAPRWSGVVPHLVLPASYLGDQALVGSVMLAMNPRLVALLSTNYRVTAGGWEHVAGRLARVVTARRGDGRLAARLWLDKATTLPLRRETFNERGQMVSQAAFTALTVGTIAAMRPPGAVPRPWVTAKPARLRAQGWPIPGSLPGNLALLGARQHHTAKGPVVDLDYSDGLSLVSVFLQRGHLQSRLTGWSRVALGGRPVYAADSDGLTFVWSAHGFVYTLVAAAPPQTVAQVVAALPHDGSPGLLVRLGHGMHRLLSWMIP